MSIAQLSKDLAQIYAQDEIYTNSTDLLAYSYDNSRQMHPPDIVVLPTNASQIQATVKLCVKYQIPLIARGRGSATTGAALAVSGGVVLSTEKLTKITKIDVANRYVIVQPGVTNQQLQDELKPYGLFWAPNPTSSDFCTIGGNLACNASGSRAVKYGSTRDNVWGLKFIDGLGRLIKSGKPVSKLSTGIDLTRLLIGSEGTLGIITEAILPLKPISETSKTLQILFADNQSATQAIVALTKLANIPSAIELIDHNCVALIKDKIKSLAKFNTVTMLLISVDGNLSNIDDDINKIEQLTNNTNRLDFTVAANEQQSQDLWLARKLLSPKLKQIAAKKINEDVIVPIANMPKLLDYTYYLADKYNLKIVNFGHAGNGNIHVNLLIDPDNKTEVELTEICLQKLFAKVIELDGAISGEHGIGLAKREFLNLEFNQDSSNLLKSIKLAFDPHLIFNPNKL